MPAASIRNLYLHAVPMPLKAGLPEHDKLDRLRELRATIAALREEGSTPDPLVAWVIAQAQRDSTQSG
jgi:hypothetical protein